jgi:hypothetical protein
VGKRDRNGSRCPYHGLPSFDRRGEQATDSRLGLHGLPVSQIAAQVDVAAITVHTNCTAATTGSGLAVICSKQRKLELHRGSFQSVFDDRCCCRKKEKRDVVRSN